MRTASVAAKPREGKPGLEPFHCVLSTRIRQTAQAGNGIQWDRTKNAHTVGWLLDAANMLTKLSTTTPFDRFHEWRKLNVQTRYDFYRPMGRSSTCGYGP